MWPTPRTGAAAMSALPRLLLCPACLVLAGAWTPAALALDPERLQGRWCLTAVSAVDGDRARPIGREWSFLPGGWLRIQSEASADVRMRVGYALADRRLAIDELDLRLDVERLSARRMAALGRGGGLRYHFERGACSESATEAGRDHDSRDELDAGSGSAAGVGDNRPVR